MAGSVAENLPGPEAVTPAAIVEALGAGDASELDPVRGTAAAAVPTVRQLPAGT